MSIKHSIESYRLYDDFDDISQYELDLLAPAVNFPIHSDDIKILKKQSTKIKKDIEKLVNDYQNRYTTKTNKSLYNLMVLSLNSELQNIIINLRYTNLDKSKESLEKMILKYLAIAIDGNKTIYNTTAKFIREVEYLYNQLIDIEYQYYVTRERNKEEQRLLKEQIAQEKAEQRKLAEEKKKLAKEELKYESEINNIKSKINDELDMKKRQKLLDRIEKLEQMLLDVDQKKETIINLQNGKAGNIYVISNIGSFGSNIFKIGMTRRLEPLDRIKELSSASVPFPFDVHSFIFSEDAPALENKLHKIFSDNRVNKVNYRKEFFKVSIDELANTITEIDPSAEFRKTILATEYRASLEQNIYCNSDI
ncbi:GIY-YIG nuclease family protein [Clostridiaceae bacterium M8S5]|nr:GIY-YIG nuclease family protein [Clostridiaceae bacterium M8S5]